MSSKFFTYSHRANPLMLLFLGILGVIWGSTIFLGILVCIGLYLALHDTSLTPKEAHLLNMKGVEVITEANGKAGQKYIYAPKGKHRNIGENQHAGKVVLILFLGAVFTITFGIFGFVIVMIWSISSLLRYLLILQKDLKTEIIGTTQK